MMSVPNLDGSTELTIAQCMLRDLEDYLKSDVVYWHVAEPNPLGSHMPQLTIGALLEALVRAEAGGADAAAAAVARAQHDQIRAAHAALYARKALHELHSRLDAWRSILDDDDRKTSVFYAQGVRVRAKIHLLEQILNAEVPIELVHYRERLDQEHFEIFVPGEFVWDARLQKPFPKNPCWWLYGHLLEEHH
jgi:hypothetical protein